MEEQVRSLRLGDLHHILFEACADAVFVYEADANDVPGPFIEVNHAACTMLGYSKSELLSMTVYDLADPASIPKSVENKNQLKENHELFTEWIHVSKSGERIPVEIHSRLLTLGKKRMVVSVSRDIRERKNMERMLEQSYQKYKSLFHSNPDGVFCFDETGQFLEVNQTGASLLGYSPEQLKGTPFLDHVVREDTLKCMEQFQAVLSGQTMTVELALRHFGGDIIHVSVSGMPMIMDGTITGFYGIVKDITWRTQLLASLNDTTDFLNALIDVAPVAIYTLDSERRITSWNKTAENLYGWSTHEILGEFDPTIPDDSSTDLYDHIVNDEPFDGVEVVRKRKDGTPIDVRIWGATLLTNTHDPIGAMAIAIDVTEHKHMAKLLHEAQKRMDDVLQSVDLFLWSLDVHSNMTFCSRGVEVYGFTPDELLMDRQPAISLIHPDDLHTFQRAVVNGRAGESFEIEFRVVLPDAKVRWLQSHGRPVRDSHGDMSRVDGVTIDITDRKISELESQERQKRYESLLNLIPDAVVVHRQGTIRYANDAAMRMFGLRDHPEGRHVWNFIHPESREAAYRRYLLVESDVNEGTVIPPVRQKLLRSDGTEFLAETSSLVIRDQGELSFLSVTKDISHQIKADNELRYMAYHDSLTGLSNRRHFVEQLDHLIEQSLSDLSEPRLAVLFIDMDRFKNVNDSYGHQFGDHALRVMTGRLQECLPVTALLSRFGGDEFAILCPVVNEDQAGDIAQTILRRFDDALLVEEREFFITPSIGIAVYPSHGTDSGTLLKHADVAMYAAKANGGNRAEFYGQVDEYTLEERLALETEMKKALERGEFVVYYQPKFRLDTGELSSVEALVRWNHPERGMIPPGQFIPIAEECGVIVPLGEWVLREACRQNRDWQQKGYTPLFVSVNVSPKQFQVRNMVEVTRIILEETKLDPSWLAIEITEGLLVHNSTQIASVLKEIRAMGVLVAIDDFGTGYSSLAYLQKFEPSHLKIDRSFVSGMFSDSGSKSIVNAVINLAHNLGMQVVAEGVEEEEQVMYLKVEGCDMAQGYFFSEPIESVALEKRFLRKSVDSFAYLRNVRA